jgi:hypothetical protein
VFSKNGDYVSLCKGNKNQRTTRSWIVVNYRQMCRKEITERLLFLDKLLVIQFEEVAIQDGGDTLE